MHELKEKLMNELREINGRGRLTSGDLEAVFKLTTSIKNIDKMSNGYSREYSREYSRDYSRDYDRGNSYRYSRDDAKSRMVERLEMMMQDADDRERETIQRCIEKIR